MAQGWGGTNDPWEADVLYMIVGSPNDHALEVGAQITCPLRDSVFPFLPASTRSHTEEKTSQVATATQANNHSHKLP